MVGEVVRVFFRLAKPWLVRCTKPRQPDFNLPYGSHVKKHDTRLLIGRIAFLTCGKSDTRHLIGLHQFANENLLCGFSVCKSQYVYNKREYLPPLRQGQREVSQGNTFKVRMLAAERISARKEAHLHKSSRTPGLLMHKMSKSQPFSTFEYLSGNETLFPSEK